MPRRDRSRAALIENAATLFRRQGYAATGLNQILDEAGVKAGSLYHHFPQGKQQLAAAVVDTAGAGIEQLLRRFLATDRSVADIVDRWIDLLVADWGRLRRYRRRKPRSGAAARAPSTAALHRRSRRAESGGW